MALSYYAMKNTRIGGHQYAVGDKILDADLNGKGPLLVKQGLAAADGASGGGGGGLVHIGTFSGGVGAVNGTNSGRFCPGIFSATYDRYRILVDGASTNRPDYMFKMILTNGTTEPPYSGNRGYYGYNHGMDYGPGSTYATTADLLYVNSDHGSYKWVIGWSDLFFSSSVDLWYPASAKVKRIQSQSMSWGYNFGEDWATSGTQRNTTGGGTLESTSTFDGMVLYTSNQDLTDLNISVFGYAKA